MRIHEGRAQIGGGVNKKKCVLVWVWELKKRVYVSSFSPPDSRVRRDAVVIAGSFARHCLIGSDRRDGVVVEGALNENRGWNQKEKKHAVLYNKIYPSLFILHLSLFLFLCTYFSLTLYPLLTLSIPVCISIIAQSSVDTNGRKLTSHPCSAGSQGPPQFRAINFNDYKL